MRAFPVVALIDDDEMMREAVASLLISAAYRTEHYGSAEAFLAQAAKSEAACLIIDMQMGGMSGIELAQRLAKLNFGFPIIFLTASNDPRLHNQALELGCIAYLLKPAGPDQLLDAVALALHR